VTGPQGGLQVLLLDESVFTLGPNSALVVDRFVYDPGTDRGELETELVRGAFRFVSGRIAKRDPTKMNVKLPAGTIGVRGTIVGAQVDPTTGRSLVWLAGPGAGNSAGIAAGSIAVENAGVTQNVERSGWGVEIPDFTTPPTPPFQVPDVTYGTLAFEVSPQGGDAQDGDESGDAPPADDRTSDTAQPAPSGSEETSGSAPPPSRSAETSSGEPPPSESTAPLSEPLALLRGGTEPASTGEFAAFEQTLGDRQSAIDVLNQDQAQMTIESMTESVARLTPTSLADLTQLSATFDGHFLFNALDVPLVSGMGDLDVLLDLDFSADVLGVQVIGIRSSVLGTQGNGMAGTSVPFTSAIGTDAKFVTQLSYFESGASLCINGCTVILTSGFQNSGEEVATIAQVSGTIGTVSTPLESIPPLDIPRMGDARSTMTVDMTTAP
jgi:hypothetical protein